MKAEDIITIERFTGELKEPDEHGYRECVFEETQFVELSVLKKDLEEQIKLLKTCPRKDNCPQVVWNFSIDFIVNWIVSNFKPVLKK